MLVEGSFAGNSALQAKHLFGSWKLQLIGLLHVEESACERLFKAKLHTALKLREGCKSVNGLITSLEEGDALLPSQVALDHSGVKEERDFPELMAATSESSELRLEGVSRGCPLEKAVSAFYEEATCDGGEQLPLLILASNWLVKWHKEEQRCASFKPRQRSHER